jgi:AbrB family looped-hinge helix DNA binding protein
MVRIKVKLGSKGQLVIPKVIRESLGLVDDQLVVLDVTDKSLRIEALDENIVEKWRRIAENEGFDVSKELIYGDKLYEEVL